MADKVLGKFGDLEVCEAVYGTRHYLYLKDVTSGRSLASTGVPQSSISKWAKTRAKARKKSLEKQIARMFQLIQQMENEFAKWEKCEEEVDKANSLTL